jgi:hypothetical protein
MFLANIDPPLVISRAMVCIAGLLMYLKVNLTICEPNEILIFSGKKRKRKSGEIAGYRFVRGGIGLRTPILEKEAVNMKKYNAEIIIPAEAEKNAEIRSTPGSLNTVIDGLENDYGFLLEGNVVSEELIAGYIAYKRKNEIDRVAPRPHPREYSLSCEI